MTLLTGSAVFTMQKAAASATTKSGKGLDDVLNEIIWMHSISDIIDAVIAAGAALVIAVVLFGVLQCFLGYKVFRYELAIIGAAVFGVGTYLGGSFLLHWVGAKLIGATIFAVIMGAGMLFTVSAFIVFLLSLGIATVVLLVNSTTQGWDMLPQVILIISFAIALICLILYKHVIIIGNVALGAGIVGFMMQGLFASKIFGLVIGIVFAVAGLITQYWIYISGARREKQALQQRERQRQQKQEPQEVKRPIPRELRKHQEEKAKAAADFLLQQEGKRQVPQSENAVNGLPTAQRTSQQVDISQTGTISTGDIRSRMKKL